MLQFLTSLLLAALLQHGASAPQKRLAVDLPKPTATMGSLEAEDSHVCVPFHHPYCTQQPHAQFPNPRGQYAEDAMAEFAHFAPLLDRNCSNKLGTLLCFLYFPFCRPGADLVVMPCRSLCEEVIRDCREALSAAGIKLKDLKHFNCRGYTYQDNQVTRPVYREERGKCANHTQLPWYPGILDPPTPKPKSIEVDPSDADPSEAEETPETTDEHTETSKAEDTCDEDTSDEDTSDEDTSDEDTSEDTSDEHTEPPTCSLCHTGPPSCDKCSIRAGANGNSFANNDYDFAFKCTLNCKDQIYGCNWALNCTVRETFDIKAKVNCSSPPVVPPNTTVLVLGSNKGCENCFLHNKIDLRVGQDYLVAGVRDTRVGDCDGQFWRCPGSSSTSLITRWVDNKFAHPRKPNKMLPTHICKGNRARNCECS